MNYHTKKVVGDYKCQKSMQLQLHAEKIPTNSEILFQISEKWEAIKAPTAMFFNQQATDCY